MTSLTLRKVSLHTRLPAKEEVITHVARDTAANQSNPGTVIPRVIASINLKNLAYGNLRVEEASLDDR